MINNDSLFISDNVVDEESYVINNAKTTVNIDARRRVENYQEQRELKRLINDELDYLDDIA